MIRTPFFILLALFVLAAISPHARGEALSLDVEVTSLPSVGSGWQTVNLSNTYTSPVVVCTFNLTTNTNAEATVRIQNITSTSFQVRAQRFEDSPSFAASPVHCIIADEGVNTLADGRVIEARTVLSTVTAGSVLGWSAGNFTNVTSLVTGGHSSLVILGQVMSFNDAKASVFTSNNCSNRGTPATTSSICVGKHIGMINGTRQHETLGFIVTQTGTGTVNGIDYAFARGPNTIAGAGNSPPYQYTVSGDFDIGVATMAAENGGNGGWAVLYGADPLPNNRINLAVDEETVAGDRSRRHINEELYYGVFRIDQSAALTASKTIALDPAASSAFAVPGSDVRYTLTVENTGTAPVDANTVFLVDTLPPEVIFYNDDIDGVTPPTEVIEFTPMSSGLTFDESTDLRFSDAPTRPTQMSDCTYPALTPGYDENIRHVCFAPKGQMAAGAIQPDAKFSLTFRAQIK